MSMLTHWAIKYIGRPWKPGGCWLLLQDIFRERHAVAMPDVHLGELGEVENVAAIKQAAQSSGWRRAEGEPQADDIVLMADVLGARHVGYMIDTLRGLRLLHADGHMTDHGPVGSVVCVSLHEATAEGYGQFELWRKP